MIGDPNIYTITSLVRNSQFYYHKYLVEFYQECIIIITIAIVVRAHTPTLEYATVWLHVIN